MTRFTKRTIAKLSVCVFLAASFLGCSGIPKKGDQEALLRDIVDSYWQSRVKQQFADCYLLEAPEVRAGVSLTNYVLGLSGGIIWVSAVSRAITIDGDFATVKLDMRYAMMGVYSPKAGLPKMQFDYWKRVEGIWYHIFKPEKIKP